MSEISIVFPHQLFQNHPALSKNRLTVLWEHPYFFTTYRFHKQKLMLHRASLRAYADQLKKAGRVVVYIEWHEPQKFDALLQSHSVTVIHLVDPVDHSLKERLITQAKKMHIRLQFYDSPSFLCTEDEIRTMLGDKEHYVMNHFYIAQRKKMSILVTSNQKPVGGSWSYDAQNRRKLPSSLVLPKPYSPEKDSYIKQAEDYIKCHFVSNPGLTDEYRWPISHTQAINALHSFLEHRLTQFGPYEDGIKNDQSFLFHSLLSSSLNNGLLTPTVVIETTVDYARHHAIPLASLEGFIRQIIGWREFIRGMYCIKGQWQRTQNYFHHTRSLPINFWNGSTGMLPCDDSIKKVLRHAYTHHIERLMILGNLMLISYTKPTDVYRWFMELFIDAYDWVMVPNIYGMSQYSDGGLMMTKPYFSSSRYILSMSNYKKGDWCSIWDSLYWHFVTTHYQKLRHNQRLSLQMAALSKIDKETLKIHRARAIDFLNSFT